MKKAAVVLLLIFLSGCAEQSTEDVTTGNVAEISTISVIAASRNWDADAEEDGIVIDIIFYDRNHDVILFKGHEFIVTVEIYTTVYNQDFQAQKGRLVYKNTFHMQSSSEIDTFWGKGLEIPFTQFSIQPGDDQFGIMDVTVEIPGVGTYYGVQEFTPLYA